jgi:cysteine desulfurase
MAEEAQVSKIATAQTGERVYLDYALRCPLRPEAVEFWKTAGEWPQGLPHSPHRSGRRAADFLDECRNGVLRAVGGKPGSKVCFYSSFTVAVNACLDAAAKNSGGGADVVLMSVAESPTVRQTVVSWASRRGLQLVEVRCGSEGCCSLEAWSEALDFHRGRVAVVVCCSASGEVGTLQPGIQLAELVRHAGTFLVREVSSAFCWVEHGSEIFSGDFLVGSASRTGAADFGAFAVFGTEPLPYQEAESVGLAGAVLHVVERWACESASLVKQMREARIYLCKELAEHFPELVTLGVEDEQLRLPHVLGVRFPGVETEALALVCDLKGVEFSSSPACLAQAINESRFLLALGLAPVEARQCCTLAVGPQTSNQEVVFAAEVIGSAAKRVKSI